MLSEPPQVTPNGFPKTRPQKHQCGANSPCLGPLEWSRCFVTPGLDLASMAWSVPPATGETVKANVLTECAKLRKIHRQNAAVKNRQGGVSKISKTLDPMLYITGWWQLKDVLFSPRKLGKMNPFWLNFSRGLKPPTSRGVWMVQIRWFSVMEKLGWFFVVPWVSS